MNAARHSLSIVIPVHNEERHLRRCLEAIAAQTVSPLEVIVADNNSTDRSVEVAAGYDFVRIARQPVQGRVFARNAGFDLAQGEVIGRIDADIVLPLDWVEHVQRFYAEPKHQTEAWSGAGYFYNIRLPRLVSFAYSLLAFRLNKVFLGHFTLWGSNMALTRTQWRAVRHEVCPRNDIHEDLDLAIHLYRRGFGITYDTTIKTRAELRRVHSDRQDLWGYLQWWPRTLRLHGNTAWPVCWFFGALLLYLASFIWVWADRLVRCFKKPSALERVVNPE